MWIFPYFMEPMIIDSYSSMSMLDYKVDYDNHPLFQHGIEHNKKEFETKFDFLKLCLKCLKFCRS